ncbi:alpha/beta hydrolase family protein [Algoriphagus halophytocola]|uniref:Esterase family protein n=1 Tax=Algoriphagus halophytocola TaxID=2991499 RepID=A0ABY6MKT8_9BACT|nr:MULTISPECIES: alpha/beta hydrolase family protein [unclassified Algoriphagus]UZD23281.1 esterase family protein [Algoriphagus sp. TR-M5]WBL44575.1 alpha/beta hydrolase family protein [Algoriphagus sp. TR-M9]
MKFPLRSQVGHLIVFIVAFIAFTNAEASVDTVTTYSASMKKEIKALVITPDSYDESKDYPVVYLLHGFSGNYKDWFTKVPSIESYANRYELIIVTPDGNFGSWYWDSPVNPQSKYETYVAEELVDFIDQQYSTIASRSGRAITGLSMGGHGALYLAFRHQDRFGAAGSMSGGVDIGPFPENWQMKDYLGAKAEFPERWKSYSVMGQLHLLSQNNLALIVSCGTGDFFYPVNLKLHEELTYNNIPHTFMTGPGGHTWNYWADAVQYHLLYFHNYFQSN